MLLIYEEVRQNSTVACGLSPEQFPNKPRLIPRKFTAPVIHAQNTGVLQIRQGGPD